MDSNLKTLDISDQLWNSPEVARYVHHRFDKTRQQCQKKDKVHSSWSRPNWKAYNRWCEAGFLNLSDIVRPKSKQQGWWLVKGDHSYLMEHSLYTKPLLGNTDLHSSFFDRFILLPQSPSFSMHLSSVAHYGYTTNSYLGFKDLGSFRKMRFQSIVLYWYEALMKYVFPKGPKWAFELLANTSESELESIFEFNLSNLLNMHSPDANIVDISSAKNEKTQKDYIYAEILYLCDTRSYSCVTPIEIDDRSQTFNTVFSMTFTCMAHKNKMWRNDDAGPKMAMSTNGGRPTARRPRLRYMWSMGRAGCSVHTSRTPTFLICHVSRLSIWIQCEIPYMKRVSCYGSDHQWPSQQLVPE